MITTIFPVALIVLSLSVPAFGQEFTAHVIGVSEGDAITVKHQGRMVRIRLRGVDCPEKGQPYFHEAKRFTSFMVDNRDVVVRPLGKDARGRTIADVLLPGGKSLNQELLQ
ncbi:MAG: thermonuclease family protein, partial [Nitrospiraceae bacterium]